MVKVEVTAEQAEAIQFLKTQYTDTQIVMHALDGVWITEAGEPNIQSLNTLDARTLVYAVDGHYIIAAEISIGDYVLYHDETALLIENEQDLALARIGHKGGRLKGYFPAKSFIRLEALDID